MQKTQRISPSVGSIGSLPISPPFFFLFILLFFLLTPAGTLQAEENRTKAADADALLQKGSELYYQSAFAEAVQAFTEAAEIDAVLGPERQLNLGFDYGWIGECYRVTAEYEKALRFYGKAIDIFRELDEEVNASIYLGNSGWIHIQLGEYDKAEALLKEAFHLAEKHIPQDTEDLINNPPTMYASLWASHLAEMKNIQGDLNGMVRYNRMALPYARSAGMDNQIYVVAYNLGNGLATLGDYQGALEAYRESLTIGEKYNHGEYIFQQLSNIGGTYIALFRYSQAEEYARRAMDLAMEMEDPGKTVQAHHLMGRVFTSQAQFEKAVGQYKEALSLQREHPELEDLESTLNFLGKTYSDWGKYQESLAYFKDGLEAAEEAGDKAGIASSYNNIGSVYHHLGDYNKALPYYEKALAIDREIHHLKDIAIVLNNMASIFDVWGEYDRAVEYFQEALSITEAQGWEADTATILNNIGLIYMSWAKYRTAEEYFNRALDLAEKIGNPDTISLYTGNLGLLAIKEEAYQQALPYLEEALEIEKKIGNRSKMAITFNNMGVVYHSLNEFEKAVEYYDKARAIAEELGEESLQISYRNNIAQLYQEQGKFQEAIDIYLKIIPLAEAANEGEGLTTMYTNLGATYYEAGQYEKAAPYFRRSVDMLEKLRLTAPGAIRRDYLDKQIHNYQWLTTTYYKIDLLPEAFGIIEQSSAKYLLEQLGESTVSWEPQDLSTHMDGMGKNEVVITFTNSRWPGPLRFVLNREYIHGAELPKKSLVATIYQDYERDIMRKTELGEGELPIAPEGLEKSTAHSIILEKKFEAVLSYYRYLLSKPILLRREAEAVEAIGKNLYLYLFGETEDMLKGVKKITIIPDGMLALIPMETLITPAGKYLAELYDISYVQSLSVLKAIQKRSYPKERKPLLAFGGAVYNPISYEEDMASTEEQYKKLAGKIEMISSQGGSLRSAYGSLGYGEITNLPGSLAEVRAIKKIIPEADLYVGETVSETTVKELSRSGKLKGYEVLHFAVHGVVVPEVPELSAIILSQEEEYGDETDTSGEDGFLSVKEITALSLQADFVNLSACETGLGKIYGGEGVVGLTQSFLVAGAKGLSVSLWKVSDDATRDFMTGMYSLVAEKGMTFAEAIAEMKRVFIGDPRRRRPFFWAPFVFYGQ